MEAYMAMKGQNKHRGKLVAKVQMVHCHSETLENIHQKYCPHVP